MVHHVCMCGKELSCVQLFTTPGLAHQLPHPWDFPNKHTGMGCHAPTQGSSSQPRIKLMSPTPPDLQVDSYLLSHQGSPLMVR